MLGDVVNYVIPVLTTGIMTLAILIVVGVISCLLIGVLIILTKTHIGVFGLAAMVVLLMCYIISKTPHIKKFRQRKDKTRQNLEKGGELKTQHHQELSYQSHVV